MNKIVVYTSIFGNYDELIDDQLLMDGVDYICFTDQLIESNTWKVIKVDPIYSDSNRNAKKYKILPHRYLKNYSSSVWIDGNLKVIGDIRKLIDNISYKVFDHNQNLLDPRNCIYEEFNAIITLGNNNGGNYKDNPKLMQEQVTRYLQQGYPPNNGLATNMIIIRNHNDPEVIRTMEDWWIEIKYGSKRDQLSFNYVAWKNKFKFKYIDGDSRNNQFFLHTGPHKKKK